MKILAAILIPVAIVLGLVGLGGAVSARSGSTVSFESGIYDVNNIPISIEGSWVINPEGYLCLRLDITNDGDRTIKDIQGMFYFTDYGHNDTIVGKYDWRESRTLYLYDTDGREIDGKSKTTIRPGETLSLVVHKMPRSWVSYMYEVHGYITWIDFGSSNCWGTKNFIASESILQSMAFKIEIEPLYGADVWGDGR